MITADQLVAHLVGDYVLQSDWMANQKRQDAYVATIHALVYSLPFLLIAGPNRSVWLWVAIIGSHAVIDHCGLARYAVFAKNFIAPPSLWPSWKNCTATGYPSERPPWLAVWLLIIADNVLHIVINGAALRWL